MWLVPMGRPLLEKLEGSMAHDERVTALCVRGVAAGDGLMRRPMLARAAHH